MVFQWTHPRPATYVRLAGVDYKLQRGGLDMVYMPNGWQVAKAIIDLNEASPPTVNDFDAEDPVDIKIEGVTMMTGYIVTPERACQPLTRNSPGKNRSLELQIADEVGYLTKGEFASDYFRSKTIKQLIEDVAGGMGVSHSVSASLSNTFKRSFYGTMAKDALSYAVDKGADWFGDESGILNAWPQSSPPSLATGGAVNYQVQDFASTGSHQIEVSHLHEYRYIPDDATHRYRNVKVVNSNRETWPQDINRITSDMFWNGTLGYSTPRWITAIEISGAPNTFRPGMSEPGPFMGGATSNAQAPALAFYTGNTGDELFATFWYIAADDVVQTSQFLGIPAGAWDQLWFHIFTSVTLADASTIEVQLIDQTTGEYYKRNIKADINTSSEWCFLLYNLPTTTSGPAGTTSNGWTKNGAGNWNKIDTIFFTFVKTSTGNNTGWPLNTSIKFATFFFARRVSATSSGAGGLNLTKPVVNDSTQNVADLLDQAGKELARVGYATKAFCTIPGHTDFKRPGYSVAVNFNETFGTGHSGTLRMEKTRHYTDRAGFYWTQLEFGPALQRL